MKPINKYEVYEDNAGGLYMCILDDEGDILRIFDSFERGERGILKAAIKELEDDPDAYESWDCDLVEYCKGEADIYELYSMIQHMTMIADNDGIEVLVMGTAGLRAFDVDY